MSIFGIIYTYGLLVMHILTVYNINIYVGLTRQHVYTCAFACVYTYISTTYLLHSTTWFGSKQHLPNTCQLYMRRIEFQATNGGN